LTVSSTVAVTYHHATPLLAVVTGHAGYIFVLFDSMYFGSELKVLMLAPPRLTLAVAESVTCGRLQARIGAISGASQFFLGGITAYTIAEKVRHLGVDRSMAEQSDAVSPEVAEQMARGACALFGSDIAVATTGYAEPAPERGVMHPMAFWALARRCNGNTYALQQGRIELPRASRIEMQEAVADAALMALLSHLRDIRITG
jgi:nicotinamide-nucleotide amidase